MGVDGNLPFDSQSPAQQSVLTVPSDIGTGAIEMAVSAQLLGKTMQARDGVEHVLAPDAALLVMDSGNGYVLDMAGSFYAIPPIGAAMLHHALEHGEDKAVAHIAARFDTDASIIRADLDRFLRDLKGRGVVRDRQGSKDRAQSSIGARLLARLAWAAGTAVVPARAGVALTLARISFALFGWVATIAAWKQTIPLGGAPSSISTTTQLIGAIDAAVRTASARHPFGGDCKERALVAWAMARTAGVPAALVVGIRHYPLGGHTWCESGDAIIGDDAEHCRRYAPLFRYE